MGYSGDLFTWQRGKIRERLDRGVTNALWNDLFPDARLVNGEMTKSDHRPLIVETDRPPAPIDHAQRGVRRFEAHWLKEETVEEMIKTAWAQAMANGEGRSFMQKTCEVHEELHTWDQKVLKGPTYRIKKLQKELERVRRGPLTEDSVAAQKEILVRLELLLEQEELTWIQRARANWLKHGDRNTSFFHHFASTRRRKKYY